MTYSEARRLALVAFGAGTLAGMALMIVLAFIGHWY